MEEAVHAPRLVRFGTFELDLQSGELRKGGLKLKLTGQPFQVLAILLEHPGAVVTREQLQKRLWSDSFVDVDHSLNTSINKIREVLGDSAENPRFVETLPRRGYRFIAPVEGTESVPKPMPRRSGTLRAPMLFAACLLLAGAGFFIYRQRQVSEPPTQRSLTRVTFDDGLQIGATWSPDGRFIAYSSSRGGKSDIWVQQVSGGDPIQITKGPGQNWQPDWSPDGKYIAYRSDNDEGALFVIPALGGAGMERKIAPFGYFPRWSPDSSQILFQTTQFAYSNAFFVVSLDGSAPRQVLKELFSGNPTAGNSAAWHPDGKRISVWVWDYLGSAHSFWTGSVTGDAVVKSEISPEIRKQFEQLAAGLVVTGWSGDFKFCWAPSGKAIYFERTFRGARNIWRMAIDPQSLQAIAIERLTTGPGFDSEPSLSPDGSKAAFTAESRHVRGWLFPFDATRGRITGPGQAVTSPGIDAWRTNLSPDGKKLVFGGNRSGKWELWETSLLDQREALVVADDSYERAFSQWSPDGTRIAYRRSKPLSGEHQLMIWSSLSHKEEPVTEASTVPKTPQDWSPDGKSLLVSVEDSTSHRAEVWLVPANSTSSDTQPARRIISDPNYSLWQAHFSPNGRWIVFEASRNEPRGWESTLYAMAADGGGWIHITEGKYWDDKTRWSPDGKTIYFLSSRSGFFNVWGIHFDPAKGEVVGDPFAVTAFDSSSLMVPMHMGRVELSLTQDRLVLSVAQVSGNIWVLDNVNR